MDNPDLDILLVQVQDGRDQVRLEAAKKLAKNPSKLAKKILIQRLKDRNADVRYWVIMALETMLDSQISQQLLDMFHDSSRLVRLAAVRIVGLRPHKLFFKPLLDALGDPDSDVRSMASLGLSRYPEKYIGQILDEFNSSQWVRKSQCFQAIRMMGNRSHEAIGSAFRAKSIPREKLYWLLQLAGEMRLKQLIPEILEVLKNSSEEEVLLSAMDALAKLGDPRAIPHLLNFLDHKSEKIRDACVESLGKHGEYAVTYLLEKLDDDSRVIRLSSMESLAKIGDVSIAPLIESFYKRDKEGRYWILNALRRMKVDVSHSIFKSLCYEEDPDLQILSISALCEFQWDDETLEILLELLDHEVWRVRNEAAVTLSKLEGLSPGFFINQLQEGNENRKYWMIKVMEYLGKAQFIPILIQQFHLDNWMLKTSVSDALQSFQDFSPEPYLDAFEEDDPNLNYWMSRSLIGCQDKSYYEVMTKLLNTSHSGTRQNAIEYFLGQGSRAGGYLGSLFSQRQPRRVYQAAVDILASEPKSAMEVLLELLSKGSREEIYWGSVLAGKIGEDALGAIHPLIESDDWKIRCNGLEAIEHIASEASIPWLRDLLEDEYTSIRKRTIRCLGRIGAVELEEEILALSQTDDLEMKIFILEALSSLKSKLAEGFFIECLRDENWLIQRQALKSVEGNPSAGFVNAMLEIYQDLSEDLLESWILAALSIADEKFLPCFEKLLEHESESVLCLSIRAVGTLGDSGASRKLLSFLEHDNWNVVKETVDALGASQDKEVIPLLKERLNDADPVLKVHLKEALRNLLGEEVWQKLLQEYLHSSKREQADRFLQEARELANSRKWKEAKKILRKAIALYEDSRSLNLLARAHAELKEYPQSEKVFMKLLKLKPSSPKVLFNLAMLYFLQEDFKRVENIFSRIEDQDVDESIKKLIENTRAKMKKKQEEQE